MVFFVKLTEADFQLRRQEEFKVVTGAQLDTLVTAAKGQALDLGYDRLFWTGDENTYAVLTMDDSEFNVTLYETLYVGNLFENGDRWRFYKAFNKEFPQGRELQNLKGIIFGGSRYSVLSPNCDWMPMLIRFVQDVWTNMPEVKMLGICFGSQLIAHALGGEVRKMDLPKDRPYLLGRE